MIAYYYSRYATRPPQMNRMLLPCSTSLSSSRNCHAPARCQLPCRPRSPNSKRSSAVERDGRPNLCRHYRYCSLSCCCRSRWRLYCVALQRQSRSQCLSDRPHVPARSRSHPLPLQSRRSEYCLWFYLACQHNNKAEQKTRLTYKPYQPILNH